MNIEQIKEKLKSEEYDFLRTDPHLGNNIILLGLGGSHAYGTNIETSDLDIRGCAINSKIEILTNMNFEQNSLSSSGGERLKAYSLKVKESIEMVEYSIDIKQIDLLCQEIKRYEKVAAFGLLKAGTVAFNLQTDLLMLGKQIYSNISYKQQLQYILSSTKEDLIIIFSYTGCYFDYPDLRALKNKLNAPQIWLISSKQETYPEFIDHVITFDSLQDQNSHPYQLQFIAGLIGQEYARIV